MKVPVRTQVLIWMSALAAIAYLQRNLGVAETTLRNQAGIDKDGMALVQSSFFWSYAIFQVPTGWLCQRWGPRAGMSIFCLTWSLATGLTGLTQSIAGLCLIRFLVGLGQAAALPCAAQVIATWFPDAERGRATAWVTAFMQVGALLNAFATGDLLENYSLAVYFWLLAIPGIAWALGFAWWYRDQPEQFASLTAEEAGQLPVRTATTANTRPIQWSRLLTSRILWLISAQQFCRAAGYIFFATWFATYMQEARHYDVKGSGIATGCAFTGVMLGALLGGTISDRILRLTGNPRWARQGVAIVSLLLCAGCVAGFFFLRGESALINVLAISLMSLGAFFSGVAGPSGYTVTIDISGKHVAAVFGYMNMAGNFGAALFAQLIPLLLGPQKDQWDRVIILFAGLYLASAVFWSFVNPADRLFDREDEQPENVAAR